MIKSVFWDLDGTLIDSEHLHTEGAIFASKMLGFKNSTTKIDRGMDGLHVFEIMSGEKFGRHNRELYQRWFKIAMDFVIENYFKSGQIKQSVELVLEFAKMGIVQAIVSNSTKDVIFNAAQNLKIDSYMSYYIGRDCVSEGKPSAIPYLKALELSYNKTSEVLVFEDSITGIIAAQAAGLDVVGVGDHLLSKNLNLGYVCKFEDPSWLDLIKSRYF